MLSGGRGIAGECASSSPPPVLSDLTEPPRMLAVALQAASELCMMVCRRGKQLSARQRRHLGRAQLWWQCDRTDPPQGGSACRFVPTMDIISSRPCTPAMGYADLCNVVTRNRHFGDDLCVVRTGELKPQFLSSPQNPRPDLRNTPRAFRRSVCATCARCAHTDMSLACLSLNISRDADAHRRHLPVDALTVVAPILTKSTPE